jgi:ketosteroid isomerase-like protein
MSHRSMTVFGCALVALTASVFGGGGSRASTAEEHAQDLTGIAKLHSQDVAATLSGDPSVLADLWTEDAVRLAQGKKADIGKPAIRAADERDQAAHPGAKIVKYVPDIKDVTIVDGWAFEWGSFTGSYKEDTGRDEKPFRVKLLRVLKKQRDGNWKFARVMWNTSE